MLRRPKNYQWYSIIYSYYVILFSQPFQAEEKYKVAVQRYDEMRDELMNDLPALNNDRNTIVGFMLACVSISCVVCVLRASRLHVVFVP